MRPQHHLISKPNLGEVNHTDVSRLSRLAAPESILIQGMRNFCKRIRATTKLTRCAQLIIRSARVTSSLVIGTLEIYSRETLKLLFDDAS